MARPQPLTCPLCGGAVRPARPPSAEDVRFYREHFGDGCPRLAPP